MHYPHSPFHYYSFDKHVIYFDDYPNSVPYVRYMTALIKLCIISHVLSIEQGCYTVPSKKRPATGFARYVTTWKETNMFVPFVNCMTPPTLETLDAKDWITIKKSMPDEVTYSFLKLKFYTDPRFLGLTTVPCMKISKRKPYWNIRSNINQRNHIKYSDVAVLKHYLIQEPREWHVIEWHLMECNFPYMSIQWRFTERDGVSNHQLHECEFLSNH